MSVLEQIGDVIEKVTGTDTDVHATFDKLASNVPQSTLQEGLAHAFNSEDTPPIPQMVANLFGQSNPDQKAGLLNQLASALGPAAAAQLANAAGVSGIANAFNSGNITPQQAAQIPPEAVQTFAQHIEKKDLSIVDAASSFYAQHPTLVKSIGAGALALLVSKISQARR